MMRIWLFVLSCLLAAACAAVAAPPAPRGPQGEGLAGFDRVMSDLMTRHGIPGGALAVVKGGRLVLLRGYGWADVERRRSVDPAVDIFALASISKTFTAVAVMRLVEQGRLSLDDRVLARLPRQALPSPSSVDPRMRDVTVRQLLQHDAGLPREGAKPRELARELGVSTPLTLPQLIRGNLQHPLAYAPGTKSVYSNLGYAMLGAVIEEAAGAPYDEVVRRQVLAPAGITDMVTLGARRRYLPNEARRYAPSGALVRHPAWAADKDAAGGWVGSALDLVKLLVALDGARGGAPLLAPATLQAMLGQPPYGPRKNGSWFGLGWDVVRTSPDGASYAKNGAILGTRTFFGHLAPDIEWAVVFNGGNASDDKEGSVDADAFRRLVGAVKAVTRWPTVDYFQQR